MVPSLPHLVLYSPTVLCRRTSCEQITARPRGPCARGRGPGRGEQRGRETGPAGVSTGTQEATRAALEQSLSEAGVTGAQGSTPSVNLLHPLTDEETECQSGPEPAPRAHGEGRRAAWAVSWSLFTAAFPRIAHHGNLLRGLPAAPVSPRGCPLSRALGPPPSHIACPPRTAFLSQTLTFSAEPRVTGSQPLCGVDCPVCPREHFHILGLVAKYCAVTHHTCVHTCASPTQSGELLEAVRPDLGARRGPELSLCRCSGNAGRGTDG